MIKRYRTWDGGGRWSSVSWIDSFGEVANWQGARETGHKSITVSSVVCFHQFVNPFFFYSGFRHLHIHSTNIGYLHCASAAQRAWEYIS